MSDAERAEHYRQLLRQVATACDDWRAANVRRQAIHPLTPAGRDAIMAETRAAVRADRLIKAALEASSPWRGQGFDSTLAAIREKVLGASE